MNTITRTLRLLAAVAVLNFPTMVSAQATGRPDLSQKAEGIVVGKLAESLENSSPAGLLLLVDRVIKGSFVPNQTINILAEGVKLRRVPGQPWGDYGMWFLESSGDSMWRIIWVPGSRILPDACYPIPEGTLPPAIPTENGAAPAPLDLMLAELAHAAETFDRGGSEFLLTMEGFFRLPRSPQLLATLRRMSHSAKIHVKVLGLTGLLFHGDPLVLAELPRDGAIRAELPAVLSFHLGNAISMVHDPALSTVSALGRIATEESGFRRSAAEALSKIHTKDTLPFLATLLDSPDPNLRNSAFEGFSRFVMNLPIETPDTVITGTWVRPLGPSSFRTSETDRHIGGAGRAPEKQAEFASFWKAWWSRMKDQLQ